MADAGRNSVSYQQSLTEVYEEYGQHRRYTASFTIISELSALVMMS